MQPEPTADQIKKADALVAEMHANDGLAPVDLDRFWVDQHIAHPDPWGGDIPQVPLGMLMSGETVFDELGVEENHYRYMHDRAWRRELNIAFNDRAEKIVGRRLLPEPSAEEPTDVYPPTGGLHDVFEAKRIWHDQSWWLMEAARTEDELKALLDRVEQRDVRATILPEGWDEARERLMAKGIKPTLYRGQRGPCTFATSVYGAENMLFLVMDNPDLAVRFRDAIIRVMLEMGRIMDEEAGYTPETAPHGFGFADDNCALFTPEMYELFGLPVLKAMFDRYSPDPGDRRAQHSDSEMGHLMPLLARVGLNDTNFGPTIWAGDIRKQLPNALIQGQLAPFTLSRNEHRNIVLEFLRDHEATRASRGLKFATAGSINNGTRLTSMRLIMAAIQRYGRYDG